MRIDTSTMPVAKAVLMYSECALDRAGASRGNPSWLAAQWTSPVKKVYHFHRGRWLVLADENGWLPASPRGGADALAAGGAPVFLGCDGEVPVFAVDHSSCNESAFVDANLGMHLVEVRQIFTQIPAVQANLVAYARGLLHGLERRRHCGRCGAPTQVHEGGHFNQCTQSSCGELYYPQIAPAVIALIEAPDGSPACLLARHRHAAAGAFSTLAGFVEVGESLEAALAREMREEAGVEVVSQRYFASQGWPFPNGLMLGFFVRARTWSFTVDGQEIIEARWFTAEELALRLPLPADQGGFRRDSIEYGLINEWVQRHGIVVNP